MRGLHRQVFLCLQFGPLCASLGHIQVEIPKLGRLTSRQDTNERSKLHLKSESARHGDTGNAATIEISSSAAFRRDDGRSQSLQRNSFRAVVSNATKFAQHHVIIPTVDAMNADSYSSSALIKLGGGATSQVTCGANFFGPDLGEDQECPEPCPYWAEDNGGENEFQPCYFRCVADLQCFDVDQKRGIADRPDLYCRSCIIEGCDECELSREDKCSKCQNGYTLHGNECVLNSRTVWFLVFGTLALLFVFILSWYFDLCCRRFTNTEALEHGMLLRSHSKLRRPAEEEDPRDHSQDAADDEPPRLPQPIETEPRRVLKVTWPMSTNLMMTNVAGSGTMLFFRTSFFVIVWGIILFVAWLVTAVAVDMDLLRLGTKDIDTPRKLCYVVDWGYSTQHKLMWAKVIFVFFAYGLTFLMAIVHAVHQQQRHYDVENATSMQDYAALCRGDFGGITGSRDIEDELKTTLHELTKEDIVGVSVGWDFVNNEDEVERLLDHDLFRLEKAAQDAPSPTSPISPLPHVPEGEGEDEDQAAERTRLKIFRAIDWVIAWVVFGVRESHFEEVPLEDKGAVRKILEGMKTLDYAFVVFQSEASRDAAVDALKDPTTSPAFGQLRLSPVPCEPDQVLWKNLAYGWTTKLKWLCAAIFTLLGALVLWAVACFVPYAVYMTSYSYSRGSEPSMATSFMFSMVVILGNELMFLVTTFMVDNVGYWVKDTCEKMYLILYSIACFLGLLMDLAVTFALVYKMMVGMNAHTHSGKLLVDLPSWREVFESYPMQKAIGYELLWFAFPPCFLLPFIIEPILTIYVPYHLGRLLVGTNSKIPSRAAEKYLEILSPMELARYGDLILNMMLTAFVFFFPGGYALMLLGALVLSHTYILLLDYYRVLRCVPSFYFASPDMDTVANAMMSIPCGILLSCGIYKFFCLPQFKDSLSNALLVSLCFPAFLFHVALHVTLLLTLVPKLGKWNYVRADRPYEEAARHMPCNWFTANPVHCLRSKYVHDHDPPCPFFRTGKEHLMRTNSKIGVYFEGSYGADPTLLSDIRHMGSVLTPLSMTHLASFGSSKSPSTQKTFPASPRSVPPSPSAVSRPQAADEKNLRTTLLPESPVQP